MGLDKFSAALDLLKGFDVNLYVGEDVFKGKLIGVESDHVVLETQNKYIFYYNIDKIQAITKNTKSFRPEKTTAHFQKTQSLKDLLHSFQNSWVTILSINKQKFTGVLSEIDTDFATLINGEERILIKLTHVSNILKGFIKEEVAKSSSSNDNDKNNDSDNKNGSKDQSDSSKKEDSDKEDSKKEEKTKSESKNDSKISDKKQAVNKKQEAVVMEEPNNTMVWSQPIKIESTMVQTKDEVSSPNSFKIKKSHSEEKDSAKASADMKKSIEDMVTKDKKSEEASSSKPKGNDQPKDTKAVKETATMQQTDNIPAPPFKLQKTEAKPSKSQDTAKFSTSSTQETKKTETTKTAEPTSNSSQNVWKQKEKEQKVFRFAGEPVSRDTQRAFPFAGWPNRNNRTSNF